MNEKPPAKRGEFSRRKERSNTLVLEPNIFNGIGQEMQHFFQLSIEKNSKNTMVYLFFFRRTVTTRLGAIPEAYERQRCTILSDMGNREQLL